jgi:ATP-dependent RNA helicase DeaD
MTETFAPSEAAAETATDDAPVYTGPRFSDLGLQASLLAEVERMGYTIPTPIQARTIPALLAGRDVVGQAQTGTGKTAAFGLPILQKLDFEDRRVQALVLAPTRELAVQVAEMVEELGRHLGPVGVVSIYGGDPIERQIRRLQGLVRVVVGTPGRILDHLRRGTLNLEAVKIAVLDEGDEMLRMGFLEDVETILAAVPTPRQMALFSATMPDEIASVARRHLTDPETISVEARALTVENIEQQYMIVEPHQRLEALARLLATEDAQAALVFARTRAGCAELAELLDSRGIPSEAMHGDLAQIARQSVLRRLKNGQLRILVATDVAARGLDIGHVDLVVNMEFPQDPSTYVHRIGRTARAGRHGRSVLLVTRREERRLRDLERFIGQRMTWRQVPTAFEVQAARMQRFAQVVKKALASQEIQHFKPLVQELLADTPPAELAAALVRLAWGDRPLPIEAPETAPVQGPVQPPALNGPEKRQAARRDHPVAADGAERPARREHPVDAAGSERPVRPERTPRPPRAVPADAPELAPADNTGFESPRRPRIPAGASRLGTDSTRVVLSFGVGRRNGVEPRDIVGAIANEAAVPGSTVGAIEIRGNYTLVEVGSDVAPKVVERMRKAMLCGRYLQPRVAPPELLAAVEPSDRAPRDEGRPPRDDARPPRSDARPPRMDTRPPHSDARPASRFDSRPPARPSRPDTRTPQRPDNRFPRPDARSQGPAARPARPDTRPPRADARPPRAEAPPAPAPVAVREPKAVTPAPIPVAAAPKKARAAAKPVDAAAKAPAAAKPKAAPKVAAVAKPKAAPKVAAAVKADAAPKKRAPAKVATTEPKKAPARKVKPKAEA